MKKFVLGTILGFTMIGISVYLLMNHKFVWTLLSSFALGWGLMELGSYIAGKFIDED